MNPLVAIDPGASGGIAFRTADGKTLCRPMPETEGDVVVVIKSLSCMNPSAVVMEQVGGFIAGKFNPGSAMFNFGMNYGILKGAVQALGMPLVLVRPQAWQKALSLGKKSDFDYFDVAKRGKSKGKKIKKNKWKEHLLDVAVSLYPEQNVTYKTADALLILKYAIDFEIDLG